MASLFLNAASLGNNWPWSPAIRVVNNDPQNSGGATPVLDLSGNAVQYLQALAGNDTGAPVSNVHVQFWAMVCAPVASPDLYLPSMGGVKGTTAPAGAGIDVPSNNAQWTQTFGTSQGTPPTPDPPQWHPLTMGPDADPQVAKYSVNGQLHCCMQANVFSTEDDKIKEGEVLTKLDPAGNRRHAQRNMIIVQHTPGMAMDFQMFVANPDLEIEQPMVVEVIPTDPRVLTWEVGELVEVAPGFLRVSREHIEGNAIEGVEVFLGDERRRLLIPERPLDDLALEVGGACAPRLELLLGPDDPQPMRINASVPDEEFAVRVLDVTQARRGEMIGGVRVIFLAVPEELRDVGPRAYEAAGS